MEKQLEQIKELVTHCCHRRPQGGRFLFIGLEEQDLRDIPALNEQSKVEYLDPRHSIDVLATTPRLLYDLIYIQHAGDLDCVIELAYQWGPKVKGGGALAGWGYRDPKIYKKLIEFIGDCPSRWPDIWALPIVEG